MERIDLTGSYTPDVSQSSQNAEALREELTAANMEERIEADKALGPAQSELEPQPTETDVVDGLEVIKPFGSQYAVPTETAPANPEAAQRMIAPFAGVTDLVTKAANLIPGFEFETAPDFDDPVAQGIREISEVLIPTLLGTGAVVGAGRAATSGVMLGAKTKMVGEIAASLGVDMAVSGLALDDDDKTVSELMAEHWGLDTPISDFARSSPDANRIVQMAENLGFSTFGELLGAAWASRQSIKLLSTGDEASEAAISKLPVISDEDPVTDVINTKRAQTAKAVEAEVEEVLDKKGFNLPGFQADKTIAEGGTLPGYQENTFRSFDEYNPFIHKGAEPHEKIVINADANPTQAKVDRAAIMTNRATNYGKPTPAATESFARKFMKAPEGSEKAQVLEEFFDGWSPSVQALINDKPMPSKVIEEMSDRVVQATMGSDVGLDEYRQLMSDMKTMVYESHKFLGEKEWVASSKAFREVFRKIYNPEHMVSRGIMAAQAGDNASSLAGAAGVLSRTGKDSTRQQMLMWDKMGLLAQEVRANQYIAGKSLELKKLVKNGDNPKVQQWFNEQGAALEKGLEAARQKGLQSVASYKEIAEKNPEYLQPFLKVIEEIDGNVDTLEKLFRYAENNIGILKKGGLLVDFMDPEIPSWFMEGVRGLVYNSLLSGKAAFNAAKGNISGLLLEPTTVFLGAARDFDTEGIRRAFHQYAGFVDAFRTASKVFADNWRQAQNSPIQNLVRPDFQAKHLDNFEAMEMMADVWKKSDPLSAEHGKYLIWNVSKSLYGFNNSKYTKYGVNAMYALDGFLSSMLGTAHARGKAYDTLMENGFRNSADFSAKFDDLAKEEYDKLFHTTGAKKGQLRDEAVIYQTKELALSLDNEMAENLAKFTARAPFLQAFMRFARTGLNAIKLDLTYIPKPKIALFNDANKVSRLFSASTKQQKINALKEFGYSEYSENMYKALKSKYIGRQMTGGAVITLAGLAAFNGKLTGAGDQDQNVQRQRIKMGTDDNYQLFGIDYRGFGPVSQLLTIVGTLAQNHDKIEPADMGEFFKLTQYAITMGPASQTFLTQLDPLVKALNGDINQWQRFVANEINAHIPYAGLRTMAGDLVDPSLKVVEESIMDYLKNKNKFLFSRELPTIRDIYSGERVRMETPSVALNNRFNPFFKLNPSIEDWRIRLKDTGWDGLQNFYKWPGTTENVTPEERAFIQNYIADNEPLAAQIVELLDDERYMGPFNKTVQEMRAAGADFDSIRLNNTKLYQRLDEIHKEARNRAFFELEKQYEEYGIIKRLTKTRDRAMQRSNAERAAALEQQRQTVREQLTKKLRQERPDKQ